VDVFAELQRQASLIRQLQGALGGNRVVRGIVDGSSGTPSISEGTGTFTITDNGVGDYTINFTQAFGDVPSVDVTAGSTAGDISGKIRDGVPVTASAARVFFRKAGAAFDTEFHFIAIGPP
jgi:hypothetical protein